MEIGPASSNATREAFITVCQPCHPHAPLPAQPWWLVQPEAPQAHRGMLSLHRAPAAVTVAPAVAPLPPSLLLLLFVRRRRCICSTYVTPTLCRCMA